MTGVTPQYRDSGLFASSEDVVVDDDPLARLELNCPGDDLEAVVDLGEDTLVGRVRRAVLLSVTLTAAACEPSGRLLCESLPGIG